MSSSRISSGIAIWLSAFGRPGTGTASPSSAPRPAFIICRRCAAAYARCCPRLSSCRIFRLLRDDADGAGADADAAADRLVLVAAAGDDAQRLAAGFDEQDDRVMELEQLVHRPQRDVVDLVEIERRVDLGGHALQDPGTRAAWRASSAAGPSARSRHRPAGSGSQVTVG